MGQKINPISLRLGNIEKWRSRWLADLKDKTKKSKKMLYAHLLEEDELIRKIIYKKVVSAGIISTEIERTPGILKIIIKVARPGLVIGQGGKGIEELAKFIEKKVLELRKKQKNPELNFRLSLNIEELKRAEVSAAYIAQQIAWDIEKRIPFRLTVKKHLDYLMQNKDIGGAKIMVKGRLDGAEIARHETFKFGALPSGNLRAQIDYGTATAFTTYGTVGVKVWIYKSQIFKK